MTQPSKTVLVEAARILIECADADGENFPVAEIMLRNILNERATNEATRRLHVISGGK